MQMQTLNADEVARAADMAEAFSGAGPLVAVALRFIAVQAREIADLRERVVALERASR